MKVDLEWWTKLGSAAQSLSIAAAVVAGGLWTLGVFAHDDYLRRFSDQAALDIEVAASQLKTPNQAGRYIQGVVTLKNLGNRNTHIPLKAKGIIVARVLPDTAGKLNFVDEVEAGFYGRPAAEPMSELLVLHGGVNRQPFLVQVQEPGLYRVFFCVERSERDSAVAKKGELTSGGAWRWTGGTFVVVD